MGKSKLPRDTGLQRTFFLKYAGRFDAKYVGKYAKYAKYAAYMQIFTYAAYFHICDFKNTIICGKIKIRSNMRIFAKYAIARSHITGIPNCHLILIAI